MKTVFEWWWEVVIVAGRTGFVLDLTLDYIY